MRSRLLTVFPIGWQVLEAWILPKVPAGSALAALHNFRGRTTDSLVCRLELRLAHGCLYVAV
jgi:hypothetical protein